MSAARQNAHQAVSNPTSQERAPSRFFFRAPGIPSARTLKNLLVIKKPSSPHV